MNQAEENNKSKKSKKIFSTFLDIFIIIFSVLLLSISGVLIFQKAYFENFFVNGQSMYPTLNYELVKPDGEKAGFGGGSSSVGSKYVDYGIMDCHQNTLKKLKRFDIIVTFYKENDTKAKIKRIIGLPGETISFTVSNDEHNGDLYVNGEFVKQPIPDDVKAHGKDYIGKTLGPDEYYVMGDNRLFDKTNRNHSDDTRTNDPVKFDWILGKAVALIGYCELSNDSLPTNINYFAWPRFL